MTMLFVWAAAVGLTVFVLYLRDPYARGMSRSRRGSLLRRFGSGLRRAHQNLCFYA